MGNDFFNAYPYTDFHELNLSWVIRELRSFATTLEQFVSINALKYADPIHWNITKQYEKNTIVIDPLTGTAYISVQPVPAGVALTNEDYWTVVFDLGSFVTRAAKNFTNNWEPATTLTATFSTSQGEWLVWGDTLYKALVNITAGDTYVVDSNIEHFTIEELYNSVINLITSNYNSLLSMIGDINDLTTTDKSNLVSAVNEIVNIVTTINSNLGDIADLHTVDKSSVVNAINEVDNHANTNAANIATLVNWVGDLSNLVTTDKSSVVGAINETYTTTNNKIGNLPDLITSNKSSTVNAINETYTHANNIRTELNTLTNNFIAEVQKRRVLVNVLDFGADPTGQEDSSAAFQAAFNYIPATSEINPGGDAIYIPSGVYILNSEIDMTSKPIEIFGDGMNATRIIGWGSADPDSGNLTYFRVKRANIHDIRFEGNQNNCVCIRYTGGHNDNWPNNVYNCMFWWCLTAVQYNGSALNYSDNQCINSSVGVSFYGSGVNSIITNSFFGLYTEGVNSASGTNLEGLTVTDCYFIGGANSTHAVCLYGSCLSGIFNNNMFDQLYGDAGIAIIDTAQDIKICNSWFGSNYVAKDCAFAIKFTGIARYIKIYGCFFVDIKTYDIYFNHASCRDIIIDSCADYWGSENLGPVNGSCVVFDEVATRVRVVSSNFTPRTAGQYGVVAPTGSTGVINMCYLSNGSPLTVVNGMP